MDDRAYSHPKVNVHDPSGTLRYELKAARTAEDILDIHIKAARDYVIDNNITDPVIIDRIVESVMNSATARLEEMGLTWIQDTQNAAIIRSNVTIGKMGHMSIVLGPTGLPKDMTRELAVNVMNDVQSLTIDIRKNVSRTLIEGVQQGLGARELGKRVAEVTDGDLARARTIARTTVMKTHNRTATETYKRAGATGYNIYPAYDERLCDKCKAIVFKNGESGELEVFDLRVNELLPIHPNCRCAVIGVWEDSAPVVVDDTHYSAQIVPITFEEVRA